ncbi:unnamed protein product, partial [Ixodes pacificus]
SEPSRTGARKRLSSEANPSLRTSWWKVRGRGAGESAKADKEENVTATWTSKR